MNSDKLTELQLNLARAIDDLKNYAQDNEGEISLDVHYEVDATRSRVYELIYQIEFFKEHGISKEEAEYIKGSSI